MACIVEMMILHDASGYRHLGEMLTSEGLLAYFKNGPSREPIYPFIISISMHVGNLLSISYQTVQIFIQIFFLFLTQLCALFLLKRLKIQPFLLALIILYIGTSSSLVNSAFRLYSEVVTYPFVLAAIYFGSLCWQFVQDSRVSQQKIIGTTFLLSLSFVILTLTRAIFELIIPIFFLPFILLALWYLIKKESRRLKNVVILLLVAITTFYIPTTLYKLVNKKYNGYFTIGNTTSATAFYGNANRRTRKLTPKKILAAFISIPRWSFCAHILDPQECSLWSFVQSDHIGFAQADVLRKQLPEDQINKMLTKLSIKSILKRPFQYILLMEFQSLKMLFWEYPAMQYSSYPNTIRKFYDNKLYLYWSIIIPPLLTFCALCFAIIFIWKNKKNLISSQDSPDDALTIMFFILILIIPYTTTFALVSILDRYSFPIVPLYLILIAFMLQKTFKKSLH